MSPSLAPFLATSLAGVSPPQGDAAEGRAAAEVVSEPVEVGAVFELEVTVEHPEHAEAAAMVEGSLGDFRVLGVVPAAPEGGERTGESRFRIRLGAFVLPGDHEIPPVPVEIRAADGALARIEAAAAPVRITSSLPPAEDGAAGDIHDIRGPFPLSVPPRWGRIGAVALLFAALSALAWLWYRRRRRREAPAAPLPAPAAEAEAALARLSAAGLLEAGDVVGFYERLAGIMKRYAGRRFETPWSERTTGEILDALGARVSGNHAGSLALLAGLLGEADLAKFSNRPFRPAAARSRLVEAGVFLDRTRPAVVAAAERPDAGGNRA